MPPKKNPKLAKAAKEKAAKAASSAASAEGGQKQKEEVTYRTTHNNTQQRRVEQIAARHAKDRQRRRATTNRERMRATQPTCAAQCRRRARGTAMRAQHRSAAYACTHPALWIRRPYDARATTAQLAASQPRLFGTRRGGPRPRSIRAASAAFGSATIEVGVCFAVVSLRSLLVHSCSLGTATGALESQPRALDVKIGGFTLTCYGKELIKDTNIEFTIGRRYGLIGSNGSGKSSFLKCLAEREVPIPDQSVAPLGSTAARGGLLFCRCACACLRIRSLIPSFFLLCCVSFSIDIFFLEEEYRKSDMNAIEAVVHVVEDEIKRLEAESERVLEEDGPECELLQDIYARLDAMDPSTFESRAAALLTGLGFEPAMMNKVRARSTQREQKRDSNQTRT